MTRQHIHFATGLPGDSGVISGMRKSADVLIYIDMNKALGDGIKFFKSTNGVILTEGVSGVLPTRYFARVVMAKTGESLL